MSQIGAIKTKTELEKVLRVVMGVKQDTQVNAWSVKDTDGNAYVWADWEPLKDANLLMRKIKEYKLEIVRKSDCRISTAVLRSNASTVWNVKYPVTGASFYHEELEVAVIGAVIHAIIDSESRNAVEKALKAE